MNYKKTLLILSIMILGISISFSNQDCGLAFGDCSDPDFQWSINFDENFVDYPTEGFSRSPESAWDYINSNPTFLLYNPELISLSHANNLENFMNLVETNVDLLSNVEIRELYEAELVNDITVLNDNPEVAQTILDDYDIEIDVNSGVSFTSLEAESDSNRILTLETSDGNTISFDLDASNGYEITENGVVVDNSFIVQSGSIYREEDSRYGISGDGIAIIGDEEFTSSEDFFIVPDDEEVTVISGNVPVSYLDGARRITGEITFENNGNYILGSNSNLTHIDEHITTRMYSTDFNPITFSTSSCEGIGSCVLRGVDTEEISITDNSILNIQIFDEREEAIIVNEITDDSLVMISSVSEGSAITLTVNSDETRMIGIPDSSNLNLLTQHRNSDGELEVHSLIDNGDFVEIGIIDTESIWESSLSCDSSNSCQIGRYSYSLSDFGTYCSRDGKCYDSSGRRVNEEGTEYINGDLRISISDFEDSDFELERSSQESVWLSEGSDSGVILSEILSSQGIGWSTALTCNIGSSCRIENSDGRGALYTRVSENMYCYEANECYDQFGYGVDRETGERTGELSSFHGDGVWREGEKYFVDLTIIPKFIDGVIVKDDWAPGMCGIGNGFNCQIGQFNYQPTNIDGETYYLARDGNYYSENGDEFRLVNGELISTGRQSSQVDFFRGGEQESIARGNGLVTLSTKGSFDFDSNFDVNRPPLSRELRPAVVSDPSFDRLNYVFPAGTIRDSGLNPALEQILQSTASDLGVTVEIYSGGQCSSCSQRTGSHRHDFGNAADFWLVDSSGNRLSLGDPIFNQFAEIAFARGVQGGGAEKGYMGNGMHLDLIGTRTGYGELWGTQGTGRPESSFEQAALMGICQRNPSRC